MLNGNRLVSSSFKKALMAAGVAAALGAGSGTASAAPFNPFTIDPQVLTSMNPVNGGGTGGYPASIGNLGKYDGQYTETFTVTGPGTFSTQAEMLFTGVDDAALGLAVSGTGLNQTNGYNLYALFSTTGTFTTVANCFGQVGCADVAPGFVTTFTANPGGTAVLWADPSVNTTFGVGTTTGGTVDDKMLANASLVLGQGSFDTGSLACVQGLSCGSFGLLFNDGLTTLGKSFFISPDPFYLQAKLNGVFDPFTPSGTSNLTGSGNLFFQAVPEPASLTLLGLGLLGVVRRRRKA